MDCDTTAACSAAISGGSEKDSCTSSLKSPHTSAWNASTYVTTGGCCAGSGEGAPASAAAAAAAAGSAAGAPAGTEVTALAVPPGASHSVAVTTVGAGGAACDEASLEGATEASPGTAPVTTGGVVDAALPLVAAVPLLALSAAHCSCAGEADDGPSVSLDAGSSGRPSNSAPDSDETTTGPCVSAGTRKLPPSWRSISGRAATRLFGPETWYAGGAASGGGGGSERAGSRAPPASQSPRAALRGRLIPARPSEPRSSWVG